MTEKDLIEHVRLLHDCCEKTGFVLSLKKTVIGATEVEVLGHLVTTDGRMCAPKKLELIDNWKLPTEKNNLQSFVCVLTYLRECIWLSILRISF